MPTRPSYGPVRQKPDMHEYIVSLSHGIMYSQTLLYQNTFGLEKTPITKKSLICCKIFIN